MPYTVVWTKDETVLSTSDFDDLSEAVRHAKTQFPIKKTRLAVTSVTVIDEKGQRHFFHDGTLEPDEPEPPARSLGLRFGAKKRG